MLHYIIAKLSDLSWLRALHHLGGCGPTHLGIESYLHLDGRDSIDAFRVSQLADRESGYVVYHVESFPF